MSDFMFAVIFYGSEIVIAALVLFWWDQRQYKRLTVDEAKLRISEEK